MSWIGGRIEVSTIDDARLIPSVPGDYNQNGDVDAADYVVWRDALAQGGPGHADGNQDGETDAADYDIWKAHFGSTSAALGARATDSTPEPATLLIVLVVFAWSLFLRTAK
jgi:hypothetical protein